MFDKNDSVWITGASSGIGKAIAGTLAGEGIKLILSSRNEQNLINASKEFENNNITIFPLDISDFKDVDSVYSQIKTDHRVGCLINNAGVTSFRSAESNSIGQIDEIIRTNLLGAIYMIKSVLPGMIERKAGIIINIISVAALKVFTNSSAYAASKSGLLAYANVLREEVREHNIKVVNILPGATKTAIWPDSVLGKYSDRMMDPTDIASVILNTINADTNLVPEEIVLRPIGGDL